MPLLVNNEPVEDSVLREEARMIRPKLQEALAGQDPQAVEKRVREWARENVIERVVLRQAALADPEPLAPAPGQDEHQQRVERLLGRVTAHLAPPRNKDVTEYYRKHRDELRQPERVHAAHIVKNVDERTDEAAAKAVMEEVERQLRDGVSFDELADRYSDCPGNGGDLGTFPRGQMVDEFDAVVFAMQPGEVSNIFRTTFGFHIVKLIARKPEGVPELHEIRAELEEFLFNDKKRRAVEQYLDRLIAKAEIREI